MSVVSATLCVFLTFKIFTNYPKMRKNCDRFFFHKTVLTFLFEKKTPIKNSFQVAQEQTPFDDVIKLIFLIKVQVVRAVRAKTLELGLTVRCHGQQSKIL